MQMFGATYLKQALHNDFLKLTHITKKKMSH